MYSGNILREKTFALTEPTVKVIPAKFCEICNAQVFSLENFPLYDIYMYTVGPFIALGANLIILQFFWKRVRGGDELVDGRAHD